MWPASRNKQFGLAIKRLRHAKNMTQCEMAEKCNLDQSYISMLEAGKRGPTLETMCKMCVAFHISLVSLAVELDGEETKK